MIPDIREATAKGSPGIFELMKLTAIDYVTEKMVHIQKFLILRLQNRERE